MADQVMLPTVPRLPPLPSDAPQWAKELRDAIIQSVYQPLAERLQGLVTFGTFAQRPAANGGQRFFWATDTNILYYDDGTWNAV